MLEASGSCNDAAAAAVAAFLTSFLRQCKLQLYLRVSAVRCGGTNLRLDFLLHSQMLGLRLSDVLASKL